MKEWGKPNERMQHL